MASSGPLSPGTLANDSSYTYGASPEAWLNPTNAASSNDSRTNVSVNIPPADAHTDYLKATNFGFAIPSGATILGVIVEVERRIGAAGIGVHDQRVRLVKGGSVQAAEDKASGSTWPGSDAYATYGSSTDLWSNTWTPAQINASDFGMVISAFIGNSDIGSAAEIDHVRITVHYTESARMIEAFI